jgi:hypothetical protein
MTCKSRKRGGGGLPDGCCESEIDLVLFDTPRTGLTNYEFIAVVNPLGGGEELHN